jgi:hypothetical protein
LCSPLCPRTTTHTRLLPTPRLHRRHRRGRPRWLLHRTCPLSRKRLPVSTSLHGSRTIPLFSTLCDQGGLLSPQDSSSIHVHVP